MRHFLSALVAMTMATSAWADEHPGEEHPSEGAMEVQPTVEGEAENPPVEAAAYPLDDASRPLVLPTGMMQPSAGLGIGLDKGAAAKSMNLALGFQYGVIDSLQAGLDLNIRLKDPVLDPDLSNIAFGTRYGLMDSVSAALDVYVTRVKIGDVSSTGFAVGISAPVKYKLADTVSFRALHNIAGRAGTGNTSLVSFGKDSFKQLAISYGLGMNLTPAFVAGLDSAFVMPDFKTDFKALPLSLSGAYSWSNMGDVGLAFGFDNLLPPDGGGGAADAKFLTLFTRMRM